MLVVQWISPQFMIHNSGDWHIRYSLMPWFSMHVCLPTIGSLHDIMKYESYISKVEPVNHEWVPNNNESIGLGLHKWALCGKKKYEFHLSTTVILPFKCCCSVYQVVRTYFHLILHGNRLWRVYFRTEPLDRSLLWDLSK